MFRRSSKLTAMLVAAAAVVSIVPASAAERLGSKDGNITTGIAFDGGYIYDGYRTDDDDAALYYNDGSKDVNIDEDEDYDYDNITKYGSKYALVYDENEPYEVDLSTGKIDDDESLQDKYENTQTKLRTALKKADRYGKITADPILSLVDAKIGSTTSASVSDSTAGEAAEYVSGKLNDVWYMYTSEVETGADGESDVNESGVLFGFTNESGKYIDASNLANLYVYSTAKDKTVKIAEYGDEEDFDSNDTKVTATLKNLQPLTQDKDYIYAVATVAVKVGTTEEPDQYFLQKISKEQGDKKDGAYVPKSVTSYQIDGGDIYKDDDMKDASALFPMGAAATGEDSYDVVNYNVKNGNIIVTGVKADSVKVYTVKLKKAKVDAIDADEASGVKEDRDAYVVMQDDDADQDLTDLALTGSGVKNSALQNSAVSIDAEGNTWALDKGTIYKFDGSEFKEMYTCDRSINSLDVYDESNLIAWDSEGDVYTTVSEGKKQTETDAGVDTDKKDDTTPVVKAGWDKNADGTWAFYKDGAKATGWLNDKGTWYYLDAAGTMKTGWVQAGSWYYLNASGAMQTGWVNDNGTWYYCNGSGAMQTGWLLDGSTWYYLNANGSMAANTTVDGYVLGANGAML